MTGQKKTENILYAVLWVIFFTTPLLTELVETRSAPDGYYDWRSVAHSCWFLGAFCVVFYLHNFFVAPILVYKGRAWRYAILLLLLLCCFQLYVSNGRINDPGMKRMPDMEMQRHDPRPQQDGHGERTGWPKEPEEIREREPHRRPAHVRFDDKDLMVLWIVILLLGANVASKYYFKTADDRKRMKELKRESLQQQLTYLKHQINPHFFMNTLNNIHALVRINPAQAEETIEVLSKLMRYVLYECDNQWVEFEKEIQFTQNYIDVMRIRFSSEIDICAKFPETPPEAEVPPLILLPFVENAFKHGISYEQHSFVHVELAANDGTAVFTCHNSRKKPENDEHGGVGLENIRKRLDLIFHKRYSLDIAATEETYSVKLTFPYTIQKP